MLLNVRLCALLLVFSIAVKFGDCENCENIKDGDIKPGSDTPKLSYLEGALKAILKPIEKGEKAIEEGIRRLGEIGKSIKDRIRGNKSGIESDEKKKTLRDLVDRFRPEINAIMPGTKWCGDGDIAKDDDDLGIFPKTDACCRAHDKCKEDIVAGQIVGNLKNDGLFTKSACICDEKFYNCLKTADNVLSFEIGKTYFDILRPQCFDCECPTDGCQPNNDTMCMNRCLKYQWHDNFKFVKI